MASLENQFTITKIAENEIHTFDTVAGLGPVPTRRFRSVQGVFVSFLLFSRPKIRFILGLSFQWVLTIWRSLIATCDPNMRSWFYRPEVTYLMRHKLCHVFHRFLREFLKCIQSTRLKCCMHGSMRRNFIWVHYQLWYRWFCMHKPVPERNYRMFKW